MVPTKFKLDQAPLLRESEVQTRWRVSRALLRKWRRLGGGPPFVKLGRSVRYRELDLEKWLGERQNLGHESQQAASS